MKIEELPKLRALKGWTQEQAARFLGVNVRTLRAWEQGTRTPKPLVLEAIEARIKELAK